MRASNSLKMSGGVVVAALLAASQTSAEISYNFGATLLGTQPDANFSLGTEFAVGATPIVIDALGAFDSGADGIGGVGIDVAIYSITLNGTAITGGSLVVPSFHFSGTAQPLLPGTSTRVASIPQVTLEAGNYMVVANHYGVSDSEVDYNPYWVGGVRSPAAPNAASANSALGVTYGGGAYNYPDGNNLSWGSTIGSPLPTGWSYDDNWSGSPSSPRYAAGNFDFTPIPEPAEFAIVGVGLLGLVIGRYPRLRRKMKLA
jgi:hypothetical protein